MAEIELVGVSKTFASGVQALSGINLAVERGEWLVLVGPSGCGKTTMLRLIAGLTEPTSGTIRFGGNPVNQVPPAQRDVAMVFQRPALLPDKSVRDNLAFGMRLKRGFWHRRSAASRDHEEASVRQAAVAVKIEHLLDRRPDELSGGEQQRVALGRAIVRQASIGLLDEPLGNLDAPLRLKLRRELPLLRDRFPATMILVTHDPAEALALGDRIAVLEDGKIVQVDRPEAIRAEPRSGFVAEFFGQQ